jgi:hypothetical protein
MRRISSRPLVMLPPWVSEEGLQAEEEIVLSGATWRVERGALGFSAMLRYTVAGQDNALGSSVATLSTNCDDKISNH